MAAQEGAAGAAAPAAGAPAGPEREPWASVRRSFERAGIRGRDHQVDAVARLLLALSDDADDDDSSGDFNGNSDGSGGEGRATTAAAAAAAGADAGGMLRRVMRQRPPAAAGPEQAPAAAAAQTPPPRGPRARNYLMQHSAGSGKSLTIAALVHALLALGRDGRQAAGGGGGGPSEGCKVEGDGAGGLANGASGGGGGQANGVRGGAFGVVLVVNDRLQLDAQLGDTIAAFLAGGRAQGAGRHMDP